MLVSPTTSVTIFRAVPGAVNEWGDETDTGSTELAFGVPAAVVEQGQIRHGISELRRELIETITVRVPGGTDVEEDDVIYDEQYNCFYLVTAVSRPQLFMGIGSVRLTATRYERGA